MDRKNRMESKQRRKTQKTVSNTTRAERDTTGRIASYGNSHGNRRSSETMRTGHGTRCWVTVWSLLLAGIALCLCGVLLYQRGDVASALTPSMTDTSASDSGNDTLTDHSDAGSENDTVTNAAAGGSGSGTVTDASAADSDNDASATVITIHNPTENASDEGNSGKAGGLSDVAQGSTDTDVSAQDSVQLLFAGDVYLSDHVLEAYDAAGGIDGVVSKGYQQDIAAADYFMVNEEFPFSTRGTPAEDKQFTFRVQPKRVQLLQEMGIDLVTLANNHALDYGRDALLDTIDTLDQAGIAHVGAGENLDQARKPVYVELKGRRFAFIGATRVIPEADWAAGTAWPGMFSAYDGGAALSKEIKEAKQQADYVIVYVHWGIEREERPNEVQTTLAHCLVDAGADLVVGAHPHVLQGIEYYKGVPIAYSLGNFVFGSSIPSTALLQAEVDDSGIQLHLIPGTSAAGYTRKLDDTEQISAFYEKMQGLSTGVQIDATGRIHAE